MSATEPELQPQSNLCQYKTGRCVNARVVKPNGALLLLCEFHRSQQNRTKKRSDIKYRQDRAKKRMVGRQQVRTEPFEQVPHSHEDKKSDTVTAAESRRPKKSARTHHPLSERLKAFAELFQQSECEFSLASPRKVRNGGSFIVTSSTTTTSSSQCGSNQGRLFSRRSIHSSVLELEDADIAVDHSISMGGEVDATSSVFPVCVTPLSTAHRCREPFWQPDDVRLLEYFIL